MGTVTKHFLVEGLKDQTLTEPNFSEIFFGKKQLMLLYSVKDLKIST